MSVRPFPLFKSNKRKQCSLLARLLVRPSGSLMGYLSYTHFVLAQLSSQYELWAEQLQSGELPQGEIKETEVQLRNLAEHLNHIQTSTYEVAQRGQDLLQVKQQDYQIKHNLFLYLALKIKKKRL